MENRKFFDQTGTIFLGDGFCGEPLCFSSPLEIVETHDPQKVLDALKKIQSLVDSGYYCAGFISYEAGAALIGLDPPPDDFPLVWFGAYEKPASEIVLPRVEQTPPFSLSSELDFNAYHSGFKEVKKEIAAGNTYQINYTFRTNFDLKDTPVNLFASLYKNHPVPYGAFINNGDHSIVSLSPELFVRRAGERLITRPMKGTASRRKDMEKDKQQARKLLASEKERAENLMIVDLMRNDLGKLASVGSVQVTELFEVEKYKTVHQMVSAVEADAPETSIPEIIKALFPSGSVTGAPKRSSMRIIEGVEKSPRRLYTGSIGLFRPDGDFSLNIAIRTALVDNQTGSVEVGLGGGVVSDGEVEREWDEAWLKGKFLFSSQPDFSLLETMRYTPAEGISMLGLHLRRLKSSARYFSIAVNISKIRRLVTEKLSRRTLPSRVRLLVDREGEVELFVSELPQNPERIEARLLKRKLSSHQKPYLNHKTTHRPYYRGIRDKFCDNGTFECIFYNEDGYVSEGTISNVFVNQAGRLLTPPLDEGLLPGVMREKMLASGAAVEKRLTVDDIRSADEIYLSNALRGLLKVDSIKF